MDARVVIGDEQNHLAFISRGPFRDVGCEVDASFVAQGVSGAFATTLRVPHLTLPQLETMQRDLAGVVEFSGRNQAMELRVKLTAQQLGHINVEAHLYDLAAVDATIRFQIDQTYLLPLIDEWRAAQ